GFSTAGGVPCKGVATWTQNNQTWHALGSNISDYHYIFSFVRGFSGQLIAGGYFATTQVEQGTGAAVNIAKWDGVSWIPLYSTPCINTTNWHFGLLAKPFDDQGGYSQVRSLVYWNGDLYAGGLFTRGGFDFNLYDSNCGVDVKNVARWDDVNHK